MEQPQSVPTPLPSFTPPPVKKNMNATAWWILVLVVGGAIGAYSYTHKTVENGGTTPVVASSLLLKGTVTNVDAAKLQFTLETPSSNFAKTVTISPATKIEKIISQKDASGKVEKQGLVEVNIGDVQKGSQVTVRYHTDIDNVLGGVESVNFTIEGNIDAYFKSQTANQVPYLKGQVVSLDIAGKNLTYHPFIFNTVSSTTMSIAIPDGVAVYRVDDPARVSITYARTAAALTDIKPGQTIFIQADAAALKANKVVPQALIISAK